MQLNDAIAQAVENSKLKKDKSQWGANGETFVCLLVFSSTFQFDIPHVFSDLYVFSL